MPRTASRCVGHSSEQMLDVKREQPDTDAYDQAKSLNSCLLFTYKHHSVTLRLVPQLTPMPLRKCPKGNKSREHSCPFFLGDVDAMEVVGPEGAVALGAFALARVVAHLQAIVAENVETFGEHRVFVARVAARAAQLGLNTQTNSTAHALDMLHRCADADANANTGLRKKREVMSAGKTMRMLLGIFFGATSRSRSSNFSHLVLVDFLLQDLVGVGVHLHLLLFLQLPPQPGQVLLGRRMRKGNSERLVSIQHTAGICPPFKNNTRVVQRK